MTKIVIPHKYVEERFRPYFIFGDSPDGTRVDVCDSGGDVVSGVARHQADWLIADRQRLLGALQVALDAHGERWYDVLIECEERVGKLPRR